MGQGAKKKRAEESKARKTKKATEQARVEIEDIPASQSNAKRTRAAPSSRVPSSSAAARHSTRLLSSSKLESSGKRTSANTHNDESVVTRRPQRSATAAANALLQQLHIDESESVDSEEDSDGKYNSEIDAKMMVLILKIQMTI